MTTRPAAVIRVGMRFFSDKAAAATPGWLRWPTLISYTDAVVDADAIVAAATGQRANRMELGCGPRLVCRLGIDSAQQRSADLERYRRLMVTHPTSCRPSKEQRVRGRQWSG